MQHIMPSFLTDLITLTFQMNTHIHSTFNSHKQILQIIVFSSHCGISLTFLVNKRHNTEFTAKVKISKYCIRRELLQN